MVSSVTSMRATRDDCQVCTSSVQSAWPCVQFAIFCIFIVVKSLLLSSRDDHKLLIVLLLNSDAKAFTAGEPFGCCAPDRTRSRSLAPRLHPHPATHQHVLILVVFGSCSMSSSPPATRLQEQRQLLRDRAKPEFADAGVGAAEDPTQRAQGVAVLLQPRMIRKLRCRTHGVVGKGTAVSRSSLQWPSHDACASLAAVH